MRGNELPQGCLEDGSPGFGGSIQTFGTRLQFHPHVHALATVASEMSTRRGLKIDDYTEAVRNLGAYAEFPREVLGALARLPGFRNVVVREYVNLDLDRAVEALRQLEPVETFARIVGEIESG